MSLLVLEWHLSLLLVPLIYVYHYYQSHWFKKYAYLFKINARRMLRILSSEHFETVFNYCR